MEVIGPYRVLEPIGSGGMGDVFLAEDTRLRRKVALKTIRSDRAGSAEAHQRLLREARAIAALNHPHIAAIYDILEPSGNAPARIVMEYVPGETLSSVLMSGALAPERALELASEVADALAAAHQQGVIHRDLKPGNVRVTQDGHAKVLDFGLAKIVVPESAETGLSIEDALKTREHQVAGTPGYMSPEQALGQSVDSKSDVYSLGVLLFEMVTGRRPFPGHGFMETSLPMLTQPTPRARSVAPDVPAAIDQFVARLMAKEPAERPTARAAFEELRDLHRTSVSPVAAPVRDSRRLQYAATAAAVAAGITAAVWTTVNHPRPAARPDRPAVVVLPLANLSGDPAKDYVGIGIADSLTTSLARVSSITVVTRSAGEGKGTVDRAKLARDLGVNLVVEGSVQQQGDRLRVNAKLVQPDGSVKWAGDTEAPSTDLFSLQTRLAAAVINALSVDLSASERTQAARPPTADSAALDEYWQALALMDRTDNAITLERAIEILEHVVARSPEFALAHARLGQAYRLRFVDTNDASWMTKASAEVARAATIDPDAIDIRISLALIYKATGRRGAAVDELRQVLARQPDNDEARRELGTILGDEGRHQEALAEYQRAVTLRPDYWGNHERVGLFFLRQGRFAEAVGAFQKVTLLRPLEASGYQQLGTAYQNLGDNEHARENYQKAIQITPAAATYSNLGTLEYSAGRYAEAAKAYEAAIKLRPSRASYHRNLGDTYLKLGQSNAARTEYAAAVKFAEQALAVNPTDALTLAQLSVFEAKVGRFDDARRHSDAAIALNPDPEILYRRAVVRALNKDTAGAIAALKEAVARGYSRTLAREDDDLASIRPLPAFAALVNPTTR